jgi:hypothetical protein
MALRPRGIVFVSVAGPAIGPRRVEGRPILTERARARAAAA